MRQLLLVENTGESFTNAPGCCGTWRDVLRTKLSPSLEQNNTVGRHTSAEAADFFLTPNRSLTCIRSVLEAIFIRRARQANADALVSFDNMVESVFGECDTFARYDVKGRTRTANKRIPWLHQLVQGFCRNDLPLSSP